MTSALDILPSQAVRRKSEGLRRRPGGSNVLLTSCETEIGGSDVLLTSCETKIGGSDVLLTDCETEIGGANQLHLI